MKTSEIRESFLSFFEGKGCKRLPSSSLIPDDPSLLLTAAGMVQFKPVFLGAKKLPYSRATTCQKCVRTSDIDIIGTTGRHLSFFEMLGNFSFGDYFKEDACAWAWEYSTKVLGLDPDRIWISVFIDDDEAEEVWKGIGVSPDRLVRLGEEDNFWAAGPTGPCGPCSELYYDQGEEYGCGKPDCAPGCDCDRYVEYWNLVFMQYDRDEAGVLSALPRKNIDTGMGLERIAAILQGVPTNFDTDLLRGLIGITEDLSGVAYGSVETSDVSMRIIADHSRAITFLVADGILPGNEGRGYVLRRLLRHAVQHGRLIGIKGEFLDKLVSAVIEEMGDAYPEIVENKELILRIVAAEEENFQATLRNGLAFLEEALDALPEGEVLDGGEVFTLHDTYGFPFEITVEIAAEHGVRVDREGFEARMEEQKQRARAHVKDEVWSTYGGLFADLARELGETDFVGYAQDAAQSQVTAIIVDGASVKEITEGQEGIILLATTPFYGERGGQVGDTGTMSGPEGATVEVVDTKIYEEVLVGHVAKMASGTLRVGDKVTATIDHLRRERIRRNHTATHLLHWALRLVLGDHVKQAGSMVAPDRLRFDFTHFEGMSTEQIDKVERLVNAKIMEDHLVLAYETSLSVARESGVTALFGEKYGEFVRVLEIGNFSKELCGGTHVGHTSEIGLLKITSEGSVGSNMRRIEAVTSFDALDWFYDIERELRDTAEGLRVPLRDVSERVAAMSKRLKDNEMQAKRMQKQVAEGNILEDADLIDVGYPVAIARLGQFSGQQLRGAWDLVKANTAEPGVPEAIVAAATDPESGNPLLIAAGTKKAVDGGFDAGAIIKAISPSIKGGGGGKPSMAQAGGKDPAGIDEALARAKEFLQGM